ARAPDLAVGAGPHVPAGLRRDDQLVPVGAEVLGEDRAEVALGRAVRRSVVVREVEVGHPEVEGPPQHRALGRERLAVPEVVPQTEGDRRQLQPGAAAPAVLHGVVAAAVGPVVIRTVGHASHPASLRRPRLIGGPWTSRTRTPPFPPSRPRRSSPRTPRPRASRRGRTSTSRRSPTTSPSSGGWRGTPRSWR